MKYRDYEVEAILRERLPGYGRSVLMVTTAESRDKAIEAARREFTVLTGLPNTLIEVIEAAPIIPLSEAGTWAQILEAAAERKEEIKNIRGGVDRENRVDRR